MTVYGLPVADDRSNFVARLITASSYSGVRVDSEESSGLNTYSVNFACFPSLFQSSDVNVANRPSSLSQNPTKCSPRQRYSMGRCEERCDIRNVRKVTLVRELNGIHYMLILGECKSRRELEVLYACTHIPAIKRVLQREWNKASCLSEYDKRANHQRAVVVVAERGKVEWE